MEKTLEEWEQEFLYELNDEIRLYNAGRAENKQLKLMGSENGNIADAYFLSWYLKDSPEYREMPYATRSQICIQTVCRNWKSFYRSMKEWKKDSKKFLGMPKAPGYLDKKNRRDALVLTKQNISSDGASSMIRSFTGLSEHSDSSGLIRFLLVGLSALKQSQRLQLKPE